jgi:NADH-quinone oxidoreductase subunit J
MNSLDLFILIVLMLTGLFTVMTSSLLKSGIGLAVTSAVLSAMMFRLGAPLAAVFELSVCAGLIPVIFITVISLTKPLKKDEALAERREKFAVQ